MDGNSLSLIVYLKSAPLSNQNTYRLSFGKWGKILVVCKKLKLLRLYYQNKSQRIMNRPARIIIGNFEYDIHVYVRVVELLKQLE